MQQAVSILRIYPTNLFIAGIFSFKVGWRAIILLVDSRRAGRSDFTGGATIGDIYCGI